MGTCPKFFVTPSFYWLYASDQWEEVSGIRSKPSSISFYWLYASDKRRITGICPLFFSRFDTLFFHFFARVQRASHAFRLAVLRNGTTEADRLDCFPFPVDVFFLRRKLDFFIFFYNMQFKFGQVFLQFFCSFSFSLLLFDLLQFFGSMAIQVIWYFLSSKLGKRIILLDNRLGIWYLRARVSFIIHAKIFFRFCLTIHVGPCIL